MERLPSKQPQIQLKSLLRLRLREMGHPWPAPKLLQKLSSGLLPTRPEVNACHDRSNGWARPLDSFLQVEVRFI
jgi:hypothetical protein